MSIYVRVVKLIIVATVAFVFIEKVGVRIVAQSMNKDTFWAFSELRIARHYEGMGLFI